MTSSHPFAAPCQWFSRLARALDRRSSPRLALLFLGAVLARGRRTVTTRIRAARMSGQFQSCYIAVAAAGKKAESIATGLFLEVVEPLLKGAGWLTLALDDTHEAVRPAGAGGLHPSQPDPRPGRLALRLRACLRRPRAARQPQGLGRERPAGAVPALYHIPFMIAEAAICKVAMTPILGHGRLGHCRRVKRSR